MPRGSEHPGPCGARWRAGGGPGGPAPEYCVDLLIQSGLNLPLVEYNDVTEVTQSRLTHRELRKTIWYDTEKSPLCYLRDRFRRPSHAAKPVFPYLGHDDWKPLILSLWQLMGGIFSKALRRLDLWDIAKEQRDEPKK